MIQMTEASLMMPRRPRRSQTQPAQREPTKLPADMEAVMPPCCIESGWSKKSRYWSLPVKAQRNQDMSIVYGWDQAEVHIPTQALMEETSKPKRAPPIVPKAAKTWTETCQLCVGEEGEYTYVDVPNSIHGCGFVR